MFRRPVMSGLLVFLFLLPIIPAMAGGPQEKSVSVAGLTPKPGRAPNQPIDEEYTKKIREYTTEPFFLSPLTDYLPASKSVPTPKAVLGYVAGAPTKLPYS